MTPFRGPTNLADVRRAKKRRDAPPTPSGTQAIADYEKRVAGTQMPTSGDPNANANPGLGGSSLEAYAPPRPLPTNQYDFASGIPSTLPAGGAAVAGGSSYGTVGTGGKGLSDWAKTLSPAELELFKKESSLNPLADNPTSTAYGIWQGLQSTRDAYGRKVGVSPNTQNPWEQLLMARAYIKDRYGTAENAWRFWQANHYY